MKKFIVLTAFVAALFLAGCGDDSAKDDNPSSNDSYSGATLTALTDDAKQCTPFIGDIAFDTTVDRDLLDWAAWSRNYSNGVMGKVFNTTLDNDECIYTQIGILDDHIALVNKFTDDFDEAGTYTIGSDTATVETDVVAVDVPFMGWSFQEPMSVPVDRIVRVTSGTLTVHMAFKITGTSEIIVEQYTDGNNAGVYYTIRDGSYLGIWHASVRDSKVQFMWDGDMDSRDFRISMCTNAGGNWEVMGGGGVDTANSEMAFMARDDDSNSSQVSYYITLTRGDFNTGTEVSIETADDTHPSGSGVLSYITEDNEDCLGFYRTNDYPDTVDDLDWNN
jgi:hypothetical protein